ncbi:MAG: hypothetical protein M4579_001346 [Chaenotheca gracillima]|nr:MAG: hypothetical protein M4579_001346 [Chaenotheca gracillima]
MPLQGLLRRNRKSDTDIRRSSVSHDDAPAARYSEHVPRDRASATQGSSFRDWVNGSRSPSANTDPSEGPSSSQPSLVSTPNVTAARSSLARSRNASDSQLSARAKQQAEKGDEAPPVPKMPAAPAIITTAPTMETLEPPQKKKSRLKLTSLLKTTSNDKDSPGASSQRTSFSGRRRASESEQQAGESSRASRVTFDESGRQSLQAQNAPPPYGDHTNSALALPISRLSESSRSDGSFGDHVAYATTTTTHTVSTTTTFFRLPRRKKNKGPLFPLPARPSETASEHGDMPRTSRSSIGAQSGTNSPMTAPSPMRLNHGLSSPLPSPSQLALATSSLNFAAPGTASVLRKHSTASTKSSRSTPSLAPPARFGRRGRSSTATSTNRDSDDLPLPTPPLPSGRTSTSTAGRNSLGGIFTFSQRLRNNSEPPIPHGGSPGTPGSSTSKSPSFNLHRESIIVPERQVEDTPAKYLARLEDAVSRSMIASVLSKGTDAFSQNVLRSYMRSFSFFEDPMDMAIRKLLMEVELPKETQQIDRVLQGFADRYHECNPGIYISPDQAYFIAFSLLILHTDVFNPNNKHKMQRHDYLKNTRGEGVSNDILECFYDNISYTPFIHVEDDVDINGERILSNKPRKIKFPRTNIDPLKKAQKEPVDPYTLIIDRKLDILRPTLKDVMNLDESYSYLGTATSLDLANLHRTFFKSGVLQIVSARSRPDAFMSPSTITNPEEAHPGVVDIKITKVGLLWRKETKKKKTRSPWQEWGAILTGSQLFLFRNTTWVKTLIHQHDSHHKQGSSGIPVIFKPPVENFKPETLMSTQDAVALLDASYKKHKNAFLFVRHGGLEETFLADTESEMNDWLAKLNYAAAFRTSGVRMRGVVGGNYEGQRSRGIRRMDTSQSGRSVQSPTGEVSIVSGKIDTQLSQQILAARRQIMTQKIEEANVKLADATKELDGLLRNARHLQILAPIQPKTREQVVLAAGRLAAQFKWKRIDIWRRKCHRDILSLDLEEETKSSAEVTLRNRTLSGTRSPVINPLGPQTLSVSRLDSKSSISPAGQRVPRSPSSARPTTQSSTKEKEFGMDEIFNAPSDVASQTSKNKTPASWELPPLSLNPQAVKRDSVSSASRKSPRPESLAHQSSNLSASARAREASISDSVRVMSRTPTLEDDESDLFREVGYVDPDALALVQQQSEAGSESEEPVSQSKDVKPKAAEGLDRHKVRRSLHRTLREAHVPTHHRSKKGKDSASSAGIPDDTASATESEGLARGTGSFTVHGKKASVINFGSEWQSMSPEERLRLRKQAHSEDSNILTKINTETESAIPNSPSIEDRRPSEATTNSLKSYAAESIPEVPPELIATQLEDDSKAELAALPESPQDSSNDTEGEDLSPSNEAPSTKEVATISSAAEENMPADRQSSSSDEEFQDAHASSTLTT